jgi:hypothetical protein
MIQINADLQSATYGDRSKHFYVYNPTVLIAIMKILITVKHNLCISHSLFWKHFSTQSGPLHTNNIKYIKHSVYNCIYKFDIITGLNLTLLGPEKFPE